MVYIIVAGVISMYTYHSTRGLDFQNIVITRW